MLDTVSAKPGHFGHWHSLERAPTIIVEMLVVGQFEMTSLYA